jgi:hypothetical protein
LLLIKTFSSSAEQFKKLKINFFFQKKKNVKPKYQYFEEIGEKFAKYVSKICFKVNLKPIYERKVNSAR